MAAKWKANPLTAQHGESPNTTTYQPTHSPLILLLTQIFSPCPSLRPGINYIISALHFLPLKVMTIFPYQTAVSSKLSFVSVFQFLILLPYTEREVKFSVLLV